MHVLYIVQSLRNKVCFHEDNGGIKPNQSSLPYNATPVSSSTFCPKTLQWPNQLIQLNLIFSP